MAVYDALAPIYDRIMSHVEYEEWINLIERVIDKYCTTSSPAIFELGGGTGILGSELLKRGFSCTGSDRSFSMCSFAARRKVPFVCFDALSIPVKKQFDLILFLYDGINYLQNPEQYSQLFAEVHRTLSPGGVFLFDITTEANSLNHFKNYLEFEDWGDFSYVRRSYYTKERLEQHNDFTIYRRIAPDSPHYERLIERHVQVVFSAGTISRMVPLSLFTIQGIWDGFSSRTYRPHSERVHFLLQKRTS